MRTSKALAFLRFQNCWFRRYACRTRSASDFHGLHSALLNVSQRFIQGNNNHQFTAVAFRGIQKQLARE
jgi:hypothetical protein